MIPGDLAAVVVSLCSRTLDNPHGRRTHDWSADGDFSQSTAYAPGGFTLLEQAVLHRYRRRTA